MRAGGGRLPDLADDADVKGFTDNAMDAVGFEDGRCNCVHHLFSPVTDHKGDISIIIGSKKYQS